MRTLIIATLAVSMMATAAQGRDPNEDITSVETVAFADLDLSSASGRKQLDRRIAAATETVCGSYSASEHHDPTLMIACRAKVAGQVKAQLARIKDSANVRMSANERR